MRSPCFPEMLQFAVQAADIGIWHWDLINNRVNWDARCGQLYGYRDDEALSYEGFLKRISPEDRQRVDDAVQGSLRERTDYMVEMRIMQADGSLRWVMGKGRGFYDGEGRPTSMSGIAMDITERKQTEESLRESEEKFSKAFQAAPSMFLISTLEGRYLDVNETLLSTLHYRRDEIVGSTVQELGIWGDPAERDRQIAILQQKGTIRNLELRLRDRYGRSIIGLVSTVLVTIRGQECLLTLTRDVTEQKKAEQERERWRLQLEAVLESINEGVIISDLEGRILTMNRAALGFHGLEAIRQARQTLLEYHGQFELLDTAGEPVPLEKWPLARALRKEQFVDYEMYVRRKGATHPRPFCYNGTVAHDREGKAMLAVLTMRDISAQKRAELEIVSLNRELAAKAAELEIKATHDALTGLWNHEEIIEILNHELARAERDGSCVSTIMADIDFFKQVNDTYGHMSGDEVLRQTAQKIRSNVRSYDFVGRYGGEEFLLILPECNRTCALSFAERIRSGVDRSLIRTQEADISITISLGVAHSCRDGRLDATTLIKISDAALYEAKRNGRNRVEAALQ